MDIGREFELILASRANQSSRKVQQLSAKRLQGSRAQFSSQTQTLEPIDQVVSQEDEMEMNLVGQEAVGRNLAQRETFFELSDVQFHPCSLFVEMPYSLRLQGKIRDKNMIKVILEFPEAQLEPFFQLFGFGPANYDKAMRSFPVVRLISKLGCLPASLSEGMVAKMLDLLLNRLGHFGHNHIAYSFLVERFDKFVVEESRVGTNTDTVKILWNLLLSSRPEHLDSSNRVGISRTQHPMPGISAVALETDQRIITGPLWFFGTVTHFGPLNPPAKDWQNSRIQIEDQTCANFGKSEHLFAQEIVYPDDSSHLQGSQALEEFSQGGRFGEGLQPQQILKTVVVMKNSSVGDALHSNHHSVNNRQDEFGGMIHAASPIPGNIVLQITLQAQLSTKALEEKHSSKESQARILEGNIDIPYTPWHSSQIPLKVSFLK